MNKLLVSDIIDLENGEYTLKVNSKDLVVNIKSNVTIYLINENLSKLDIIMQDNSNLKIYIFNKIWHNNLDVNINQVNNSKINFNMSYTNDGDSNIIINNYLDGNNNESIINTRCVSNIGNSKIIINVNVAKDTINNIAVEDIKGINNGGFVHIEPNIIVLSNEVEANHLTTIGSLDKDAINYLLSKGISNKDAKDLLLNGFIYSNMDNYIKSLDERGEKGA